MDVNDAFTTPKSNVQGSSAGDNGSVTSGMIQQLKRTRPWVLFLSILGFIGTFFMAIGTVGMFAGGAAMFAKAGSQAAGIATGAGVAYLLMTLLYFFASLYLFKYAKSIKKAVNLGGSEHVENALKSQASFWKLVGILTAIMIVLMILAMVFGVGSAMMGLGGAGMGLPSPS